MELTCKECGRTLPETAFKTTRWGTKAGVCTECATAKRKLATDNKRIKEVTDARTMRLRDFTPRELMEELAARGYKGTLTYTITQTIDITDF